MGADGEDLACHLQLECINCLDASRVHRRGLYAHRRDLGRALVVHAQEDVFTQPSGDAGDRVAFGLMETKSIEERSDES